MTEWITDREPATSGVYLVTILDRSSNTFYLRERK